MPRKKVSDAQIRKTFWQQTVAELPELARLLGCSTRTVLRHLADMGYHSSYNFAGRYHTLTGIPDFDNDGLWGHGKAWFSRTGTLRNTVSDIVEKSRAGMTCGQLQDKLHVRVDSRLPGYLSGGDVASKKYGHIRVYYSRHAPRREVQMAARERVLDEKPARPASGRKLFSTRQSALLGIEVLSAKLHHRQWNAVEICHALQQQGTGVTLEQVQRIFEHFELGKKNSAPGTS
jgi:hypothetical protein